MVIVLYKLDKFFVFIFIALLFIEWSEGNFVQHFVPVVQLIAFAYSLLCLDRVDIWHSLLILL